MPELEERLRPLRAQAREWAAQLRPYALELDRDPDLISRLDLPVLRESARLQIPGEYNPAPLVLAGHRYLLTSATERIVVCEEMARGDLGMTLALPGGSMSGVLVDVIGDRDQKEWFYGRLLERPAWTFFALTEPDGGSDATAMRTRITPDGAGFVLDGAKRYVSNGVRAGLGVVFCRAGQGPLGVAAVLVESSAPGFGAAPIETVGVRGAQLAAITLHSVPVGPDRILGRHLSPVRRGTWGMLRTLNRLRPTVAAMGVGLAQAAYDYVRDNRHALRTEERDRLDRIGRRIEGVRRLTRRAALAVDHDPGDGHLAAAAKLSASRLAEEVTLRALEFFGAGARFEQPLLEKYARDGRALEFMEGTANMQRLSLFTALSRRTTGPRSRQRGPAC